MSYTVRVIRLKADCNTKMSTPVTDYFCDVIEWLDMVRNGLLPDLGRPGYEYAFRTGQSQDLIWVDLYIDDRESAGMVAVRFNGHNPESILL